MGEELQISYVGNPPGSRKSGLILVLSSVGWTSQITSKEWSKESKKETLKHRQRRQPSLSASDQREPLQEHVMLTSHIPSVALNLLNSSLILGTPKRRKIRQNTNTL